VKTFQTDLEVAADGTLVISEMPFKAGERVRVIVASSADALEMQKYAERMAPLSGEFVAETERHVATRLLRATEW
jgi:hypothetical protein